MYDYCYWCYCVTLWLGRPRQIVNRKLQPVYRKLSVVFTPFQYYMMKSHSSFLRTGHRLVVLSPFAAKSHNSSPAGDVASRVCLDVS